MLQVLKAEYSALMSVLTESKPVEAVKEEAIALSDIIKNLQQKINPEGLFSVFATQLNASVHLMILSI